MTAVVGAHGVYLMCHKPFGSTVMASKFWWMYITLEYILFLTVGVSFVNDMLTLAEALNAISALIPLAYVTRRNT